MADHLGVADLLTPAAGAAAACEAEGGAVAVSKDGGVYKTTWWAFPFEALPTAQSRLAAMQRFLDWCLGSASSVLFADGFETGDSSKWDQTVNP